MRILVLTTSYPRFAGDPSGHFVEAEVNALRAAGHDVDVYTAGAPNLAGGSSNATHLGGERLFAAPGALPRLKAQPARIWGLVEASATLLRNVLGRKKPMKAYDAVHAHWLFPCALPWALTVRGAPALTVTLHGSDVALFIAMPRPLQRLALEKLRRRSATLIFVAEHLKQAMLECALPGELRAFVSAAQVRPARLEVEMSATHQEARRHLGLRPESRVLLIVGRLIESKRVEVALSAADLVPDAEIVVVGDGPLLAPLQSRYPQARFLGPLPRQQALLWIRAADLLINASRKEGAPTTLREAESLGTAVVSVQVGDIKRAAPPWLWLID